MCEPSQQFAYKTWVQFPFFFLHRHRRFFYVRIIPDCLSCRLKKVSGIVHAWTATAQNRNKSFTHTEHRAGAVGSEGLRAKSQSSLPNVYLRFSGFDSSFLLIHFRDDGPNRCSQCTIVWHGNYPICDAPLSILVRCSFTPSQKSGRNHRFCVWTETLSGFRACAKAIWYSMNIA